MGKHVGEKLLSFCWPSESKFRTLPSGGVLDLIIVRFEVSRSKVALSIVGAISIHLITFKAGKI